jgi:hypothetical protein
MDEVREGWANVYPAEADVEGDIGCLHETREIAEAANANIALAGFAPATYRIHVRLKPEGAPRRYASANERKAWEASPYGARLVSNVYGREVLSPRTPKIEESAK